MDERVVLLLGRSLLLSGVAASLEECIGMRVATVATWAEAEAALAQHMADVIIFDLAFAGESHLLLLLCQNPQLVLVGLDAECNRAVLLAGRETRALTLKWVREIVEVGSL
jgi:hypothetical protein